MAYNSIHWFKPHYLWNERSFWDKVYRNRYCSHCRIFYLVLMWFYSKFFLPKMYIYAHDKLNLTVFWKYMRKNAQVVTNLQQTCSKSAPTTCQQDVFALPITACCDGLVATCWQTCSNLLTDMYQGCCDNAVASCCNKFVASRLTRCSKLLNNS
jgi:hypothetical protein